MKTFLQFCNLLVIVYTIPNRFPNVFKCPRNTNILITNAHLHEGCSVSTAKTTDDVGIHPGFGLCVWLWNMTTLLFGH